MGDDGTLASQREPQALQDRALALDLGRGSFLEGGQAGGDMPAQACVPGI